MLTFSVFSHKLTWRVCGPVNSCNIGYLMNRYKHSGAFGDLIYSLPIVKATGGGEFYLHLNQIDWIGKHYYGSPPNPFHQGRLNIDDFNFMQSFMSVQEYITDFDMFTPDKEITHNLDRFRAPFVGHPGNYVDIYSACFGILGREDQAQLRNTAWLTVPKAKIVEARDVVINRSARWQPRSLSPQWDQWKAEGMEDRAMFVGLPEEYTAFREATGYNIPYYATNTMLELAEVIAGANLFIGNQSMSLALAFGLGKEVFCEHRDDLPLERNECFFGDRPNTTYF